jgi:hypothetical protein
MKEDHCPECGCVLRHERSLPHHRLFFAFIEAAYKQWPSAHEWRPGSKEELRAWALIKAGHHSTTLYTFKTEGEAELVCRVLKRDYERERLDGRFVWVQPFHEVGKLRGASKLSALSIKFRKLSQERFNEVSAGVIQAIEQETGFDFDAWRNIEGIHHDKTGGSIPGGTVRRQILRDRVRELRGLGEGGDGAGEDRRPDH